jgi:hypothetical protein
MVNVTVEARNDVDDPGLIKLQGETWELNALLSLLAATNSVAHPLHQLFETSGIV